MLPRVKDDDVAVLKFGSSLLDGAHGFRTAAAEVDRWVRHGYRVVAVCSARDGVTDELLRAAAALGHGAPDGLLARLLGTGESASVALLALALASCGVSAHVMDVASLGLRTRGRLLDADPVDVDVEGLRARLRISQAVVVPGFLGIDESGEPSLLGRGGSDLTALFLAHRLGASECRLLKDVDGLFSADPKMDPGARVFPRATWQQVVEQGGGVVQPKAVAFAETQRRPFVIAAPGGQGTWVGVPAEVVA